MSIETDGLLEGGPFKVTASVTAGFVKNDASGNLLFGQAASAWDLIEFKTFSSPSSIHSFDAVLDGDADDTYQIILQAFGPSSASNSTGYLVINGLSTLGVVIGQTRHKGTIAFNGGGLSSTSGGGWQLWREFGAFRVSGIYARAIIYAKTGKIRTGISWSSSQRSIGPTFQSVGVQYAQRWDDTTTNITSIGFHGLRSSRVSYAWLYKIKTT